MTPMGFPEAKKIYFKNDLLLGFRSGLIYRGTKDNLEQSHVYAAVANQTEENEKEGACRSNEPVYLLSTAWD
jgi:hypothetical protein